MAGAAVPLYCPMHEAWSVGQVQSPSHGGRGRLSENIIDTWRLGALSWRATELRKAAGGSSQSGQARRG